MCTVEHLAALRQRLGRPEQWLKYEDAVIPRARRSGRIDLFRSCETVTREGDALVLLYSTLAGMIRNLHPERISPRGGASKHDHITDIMDFNNHPDTNHDDVLRLLDACLSSQPLHA
jgi:hypothetical protein